MKQTSSIGIMDFIRPHKGGFLCSVVLSVLGGPVVLYHTLQSQR